MTRPLLTAALALLAAPVAAQDDAAAAAAFAAGFGDTCLTALREDGTVMHEVERHDLTVPSPWGDPEPMVIWSFVCDIGAYNMQKVHFGWSESMGLHPLALARPSYDVLTEDPDDIDSPVTGIVLTGMEAGYAAVNPVFDPATLTLTETGYWRGIGDASSIATWRLGPEGFRLIRYEVDATYDGEVAHEVLLAFD